MFAPPNPRSHVSSATLAQAPLKPGSGLLRSAHPLSRAAQPRLASVEINTSNEGPEKGPLPSQGSQICSTYTMRTDTGGNASGRMPLPRYSNNSVSSHYCNYEFSLPSSLSPSLPSSLIFSSTFPLIFSLISLIYLLLFLLGIILYLKV
jgi:hypothetical protein